jgi:potassium uptake TrkH family protein
VVIAFVAAIALGTGLLWLPLAADGPGHVGVSHALFTATSAVTVTGLGTVSIEEFSLFGELIILALIQIGGFGIMTIGAVLALLVSSRVGLRQRKLAQAEIGAVDLGELRRLILAIAKITIAFEGVVALVLWLRIWLIHDGSVGEAAYSGIFHSIAGFNNAGISLYPDNLTRYVADPFIVMTLTASFIAGGLGFPVMVQLLRRVRPRHWTLHTRITLAGTALLLVVGPAMVLAFEWTNPDTLGPLDLGGKLLAGWFQGTTPRTAGFNTVDIGAMNETTLLGVIALMFIGAGPASTSGGIKVTTFALLGFVLWSEVRGDAETNVLHRRIPASVIKQAIAVVIMAIGTIVLVTLVVMVLGDVTLTPALFEATSAFGTVGLSTGITAELPTLAHLALVLLMLAGRVGPTTLATALAFRQRSQAFRYPEERPIIG